jgi:putative transposase
MFFPIGLADGFEVFAAKSEFLCIECGHTDHADRVGAFNVLRAGHAQLACAASAIAQQ